MLSENNLVEVVISTLKSLEKVIFELPIQDQIFDQVRPAKIYCNYLQNEPQGSGKYYSFIHKLIKTNKVSTIVELGNREGLSLLAMAAATDENQKITTVDTINDLRFVPEKVRTNKNINFIFGDCLRPDIIKQMPQNIDLIFFDTLHTFSHIKQQWDAYEPLLADQAIVLIDDVNLADKNKIMDELKTNNKIKFLENRIDLHVSGFGVIVYKRNEI